MGRPVEGAVLYSGDEAAIESYDGDKQYMPGLTGPDVFAMLECSACPQGSFNPFPSLNNCFKPSDLPVEPTSFNSATSSVMSIFSDAVGTVTLANGDGEPFWRVNPGPSKSPFVSFDRANQGNSAALVLWFNLSWFLELEGDEAPSLLSAQLW